MAGQCLRTDPTDQWCRRRRVALDQVQFLRTTPTAVALPNRGIVYQWVTGSDAATSPIVAADVGNPLDRGPGRLCEQCLHRLGQHRHRTRQYQSLCRAGLQPEPGRAGRRDALTSPTSANEDSMAFSGVTTVNVGGNFGPQDNSHPQLVINQNDGGQVTVAWDDFGTGPRPGAIPYDISCRSSSSPVIRSGLARPILGTMPTPALSPRAIWAPAVVYNAGPQGSNADPVSIAVGDVDGKNGNDIVVADDGIGQLGELLNTGTGVFTGTTPATTPNVTALTYNAGNGPSGVVLGDFASSTLNAGVSNSPGGMSVLTNDGTGNFGVLSHYAVSGEQNTDAIADGNLDGSGLSLVVADENSSTITIFPDGAGSGCVLVLVRGE